MDEVSCEALPEADQGHRAIEGLSCDDVPCGLMRYALDGDALRLEDCNETAWRMLGYDSRAHCIEAGGHPIGSGRCQADDKILLPKNPLDFDGLSIDERLIPSDGAARWIHSEFKKVEPQPGVVRIIRVLVDVTQQKLKELQQYSNVLCNFFEEIFEFDFARQTLSVVFSSHLSDVTKAMQFDLDESVRRWVSTYIHPEDRDAVMRFFDEDHINEECCDGHAPSIDYRLVPRDGNVVWRCSSLLRIDGCRYLCCSRDITARKEAAELREHNARLRLISEEQARYKAIVDQTNTAVVEWNHATNALFYSQLYGKYEASRHDLIAILSGEESPASSVHPDDCATAINVINTLKKSGVASETLRALMTDGTYRWTRIAVTRLYDGNGKPLRTIGSLNDVNDESVAKRALEATSEQLNSTIANVPFGIVIYDIDKEIIPVFASDRALEMFGVTRDAYEQRIEQATPVAMHPSDREMTRKALADLKEGGVLEREIEIHRPDGTEIWARALCNLAFGSDGRELCYASLADITDVVEIRRKNEWQLERYRLLSEASNVIMFDYAPADDVMTASLNSEGSGLTNTVIPRFMKNFADHRFIDEQSLAACCTALNRACEHPGTASFDFRANLRGTGFLWYRSLHVGLADDHGRVYRVVGRIEDADEVIRAQMDLVDRAQTDAGTGLLNKDTAKRIIDMSLSTRPPGRVDAMFVIDLDDFKDINDTYGHLEGDSVLRVFADLIKSTFRETDVLLRFGGDEFVVYMHSVKDPEIVRKKAAEAATILGRVGVAKGTDALSCSIGVAVASPHDTTFEALFEKADKALYRAKKLGKQRYILYEEA